jgi:methionyl-tRNA synthetase
MNTFYITTPIYYANSLPHLGHLYTTVVADVINRSKRQRGFETFFLTGTDEHGVNIQRAADKSGRTPSEQADYISGELIKTFDAFGLGPETGGYDIFMRTTTGFHREGAQTFWRTIAAGKTPAGNDNIYKGFYDAWFCAACAEYKTEKEYYLKEGEQTPSCLVHETVLERVSEESYFFRLSDYGPVLLRIIEENPQRIRPEGRRNEVVAFIKSGLQDLSISRETKSVSWGIPVPGDDKHVMYVWLDALSNYITALGYGNAERQGLDKFWPSATHLVGKDILRFHTIYWWSFLLAAGVDLPQVVFAHGMWLDTEGRKMGKTLGNTIKLPVLRQFFSNDSLRYFLLREMVFGQDGKFGYENLIDRVNADLAGGLGNLSSRTLTMVEKYCGGAVPSGNISEQNYIYAKRAGVAADAQELASVLSHARDEFLREFDDFNFSRALEVLWSVIARVDKIISDAKPWELAKDDSQRETLNTVLYRSLEALRWLCVLLSPVMPSATQSIYSQLGFSGSPAAVNPETLIWGDLPEGTAVGRVTAVFPRLDKIKIMQEIENDSTDAAGTAGNTTTADAAEKPSGETDEDFITIDDFIKVELRVGEILTAERIPKSDKLLKFSVDVGEESPRQILAGIAEFYEPEPLVGKKIVVVSNLKPRKLRGFESQGMVCAASAGEGGKPVLATFGEDVPNGTRIK